MHESPINFIARSESFLGAQLYPLMSVLSLLLTTVVELRGCNSVWPMEWKLFTAWPFKNRSANLESNRLTWQQVRWAQLHLLNALLVYGGFSRGLGASSSRLPNLSHRCEPHLCRRFTVKHQSLGRLPSVGDAGVKTPTKFETHPLQVHLLVCSQCQSSPPCPCKGLSLPTEKEVNLCIMEGPNWERFLKIHILFSYTFLGTRFVPY